MQKNKYLCAIFHSINQENMLKTKLFLTKSGQRMMTLATLFMLAVASLAADLNWNFKFSPSDIVLTPSGQYTVVTIADGAMPRDAIGAPAMPAKYANILLPDGATDVTVTATGELVRLASDVTLWPTQRATPKSKKQAPFVEPDPVAYASSNPWPAVAATNEGLHEMQGNTFVSVRVNPVVYVASEKALYYRPSITVTVTYNAPAAPRGGQHHAGVTQMVNALVVNPAEAVAPSTNGRRSADGSAVDYLIITSNSLKSAFQPLADYRATAVGGSYNTLIITKEDIQNNYTGDDVQMKIRNCIADYYNNHGVKFVVLGGDDTIVPDRDTYAKVDDEVENNMPTDLYYSDLTGTWKASGKYGVTTANIDMTPEVIVGRIPVRTASQASAYIAKVQAFEGDLTQTRNSIILGGPNAWNTYSGNNRPTDDVTGDGHAGFRASNHTTVSDSEMWLRRLYRDGITPYWNNIEEANERTVNLACDYITSWDNSTCGDKPLSGANLKTWLNNGYTHLMFSGHGYPQGWGMETSDDYDSDKAAAQTALTAIVYTDACLTGAFDGTSLQLDYWSSYTTEPCLGEAFLRNANGGALAYMGCARYGWGEPDDGAASNTSDGGPSTVYAYKFYHRLYEDDAIAENRTVGEAFAMSKADMISQCSSYNCERWIQFGLNYLGDPAIALYPRITIDAPSDVALSDVVPSAMTASWTAVDDAEDYEVEVATITKSVVDQAFLTESFTGFTKSNGYTSTMDSQTVASGTWSYKKVIFNPEANANGVGSAGLAQLQGKAGELYLPVIDTPINIKVNCRASAAGGTLLLQQKVNDTWTTIETWSITTSCVTYSHTFADPCEGMEFRLKAGNKATYIYDVIVNSTAVVSNKTTVEGYPKLVGNVTSVSLTGLQPGTEYEVRVRTINGTRRSSWSPIIIAVTTEPESGDANGDGMVSITDAVGVVNYILGNTSSGFLKSAGDTNGDGEITITDAVGVVNIILDQSNQPATAPQLTPEPTEDTEDTAVEPE